MKELPRQRGPDAAGFEAKTRVVVPIVRPLDSETDVDTKPIVARGIAVKRSEYL